MAIKYFYVGGMGPYFYDDTDTLLDPDGNFPGETSNALVTSGQLIVEETPSDDNNVARLIDLLNNITEIFTVTGTINKNTQVALASGTFDLFLPTLATAETRIIEIKNYGTGLVTLKPNATEAAIEIEGEVSQPLGTGDSVTVTATATEWWVI